MDFNLRLSFALFPIGLVAGYVMHRSDFCLSALVRDVFLAGSYSLLRALLVFVFISSLGFEFLRLGGVVEKFFYPPPSLNHLLGGALFGLGMTIAGTCVVGVWWRLGTGQMAAGATILGLIVGSGIFAELYPLSNAVNEATVITGANTLPALFGVTPLALILPLCLLLLISFNRWKKRGLWEGANLIPYFMTKWKAAAALALLAMASLAVSGFSFSMALLYSKAAGYLEALVAPDHVASLDFFTSAHEIPMDFQGGVVTLCSGPLWDSFAAIQCALLLGLFLGAVASAKLSNEFHIYARIPARQYFMAITGGVIMAIGARAASGCNVWHLLGGLPVLSLSSILFFAGLFPGAWAGVFFLKRGITS